MTFKSVCKEASKNVDSKLSHEEKINLIAPAKEHLRNYVVEGFTLEEAYQDLRAGLQEAFLIQKMALEAAAHELSIEYKN